ncbi:MAG: LysE family translocator [Rhodobacteraceae bacterium]|nr:LysE family translocator [Paracoccaceae bacterium]
MSVAIASFTVFAASQVGTPGPANMALLATGARYGLRRALPFVAGVALGKQLVIWPIGFGLLALAQQMPVLFAALKWISAAYIIWLAWRVANSSLNPGTAGGKSPGFAAGLVVHPLNPKAWGMITAGFTGFVEPGTPPLTATIWIASILFLCQLVLHPMWCWGGEKLASVVAGRPQERALMLSLAGLTVLSVLFVLILGEQV